MVLILAFSLQDQAEKYGAYVGFAAFLGLAVLTLLYFAQARELKRLRDWAGRAPERALELEARVVAQAEEALRGEGAEPSGTVGPARPVERPPTAVPASGNGRQPAPIPMGPRPATAIAAARAATAAVATAEAPAIAQPAESPDGGPASPDVSPSPAPAGGDGAPEPARTGEEVTAAAGTGEAPPAAGDPVGTGEAPPSPGDAAEERPPAPAEPEPARPGNGVSAETAIPRATPRPQPVAPLRAATPRSTTLPPRRGLAGRPSQADSGSSRAARVTLLTLLAVVLLGGGAFAATQILGDDEPAPAPNRTAVPGDEPTPGSDAGGPAVPARSETIVAVLNGTPTEGLASQMRDKLIGEGYSDEQGMIRTGNNTDQQRQDSVVLFASRKRRQARDVAAVLGIEAIEAIDSETQFLADSTDETNSGRHADVVVILGADQSP
jgi:hypothetical protein